MGDFEDWTNFLNLTQSWEGKFKTGTKHGTKMKNNPVYTVAETLLIGSRILHSPGQQTQVRANTSILFMLNDTMRRGRRGNNGHTQIINIHRHGNGERDGVKPPPPRHFYIPGISELRPWEYVFRNNSSFLRTNILQCIGLHLYMKHKTWLIKVSWLMNYCSQSCKIYIHVKMKTTFHIFQKYR